jgi:integrase
LPDGSWTKPFSLQTDDEMAAAFNAVGELEKRDQLFILGVPQPGRQPKMAIVKSTKTFGDAAQTEIERLTLARNDTRIREGRQKAHKYDQHLRRIKNILMPAFNDYPVQDISRSKVNDWMREYQVTAIGREPKKPSQNTVGNYNHSFQYVMEIAVEKGWIKKDDVPSISKKGFERPIENPWLSQTEVEKLRNHMTDDWVYNTHKKISVEDRFLLRAYVALLSTTGIRPGLEIE